MVSFEYEVQFERVHEAQKMLDKLLKKASKFGISPISYRWGEEKVVQKEVRNNITGEVRTKVLRHVRVLHVEGEPPRVPGFTFIARVEFAEAGKLIMTVPGQHVPAEYFDVDGHCDHCKKVRARKDVFLVQKDSGEIIQVGRQCLQDFIGNNPEMILRTFQWLRSFEQAMEDEDRAGRGGNYFVNVADEFLADVATIIRVFGWTSGKAAREYMQNYEKTIPTSVQLAMKRHDWNEDETKWFRQNVEAVQSADDHELAKQTIEWVKKFEFSHNEYEHNLFVILSSPYIYSYKHLAIAGSAVAGLMREQQKELFKAKAKAASNWVGEIDKRFRDMVVTLNQAIGLPESQFGPRVLYKFSDDSGNQLVWFTGPQDLKVNAQYKLTATVKEHSEWEGLKQTKISRAVLFDLPAVCVQEGGK